MSKSSDPQRTYNFSDAKLPQLGDTFVSIVNRDMADLAGYGVTAATAAALQTKIDTFNNHPTDEEYLGLLISGTQTKNTKRDELEMKIRTVEVRVLNKYGPGHSNLSLLAVGAISQEADNNLVRTARRVGRVLATLQADLATEGVDAAFVAAYDTLVTDYDIALDNQDDAVRNREIGKRDRVKFGNELYADIVKIANYGKDFYYSTDATKYNDYLISDQANEIGQQRTGALNNGERAYLDFTGVDATDSFRLKVPVGSKMQFYFSTTNTGDPGGPVLALVGEADELRTAAELGYTDLIPFLIARNTDGPSPSLYEVYRVG